MNRRCLFVAATVASAVAATPAFAQTRRRREARGGFFATSDGSHLFHRDVGEGPPIVFASGWTLPSEMWNYQTAALVDQGFRCVSYDRRGHGRSEDPGRGYDFDTFADDLNALLETLDLRGVTLVGYSMAAGELVRLVSRHSARRIARLLFLAPACTPCLTAVVDPALFETVRREQLMRDFPKWLRDNARPFVTADTSPAMMDWIMQMMLQPALPAVIACHRAMTNADFRAELPRLTRPALIIHGGRDASAPLAITGRPTAEMIPGAMLRIYDDAPHGLFVTHATRLNADIAAFARG